MMWYLVYFPATKDNCVVSGDDLDKKNPALDEIVGVVYPDAIYPGKILRKSDKKGYLDALIVSPDGEVFVDTNSEYLKKRAKKTLGKRPNKAAAKTTTKKARKNTDHLQNMDILKEKEEENSVPASNKRSKRRKSQSKILIEDDSADSECEDLGKENIEVQSNERNDIPELITEYTGTVDDPTDKIPVYTEKVDEIYEVFRRTCQDVPVSTETIRFIQYMLSHAITLHNAQIREKRKNSTVVEKTSTPIPSWRFADDSKVELLPFSSVWINAINLGLFKRRANGDANKMTRMLFRDLIGDKKLSESTAKGLSGKPRIDEAVFNTVELYIQKEFFKGEVHEGFTDVVNNMICTIRSERKKAGVLGEMKKRSTLETNSTENEGLQDTEEKEETSRHKENDFTVDPSVARDGMISNEIFSAGRKNLITPQGKKSNDGRKNLPAANLLISDERSSEMTLQKGQGDSELQKEEESLVRRTEKSTVDHHDKAYPPLPIYAHAPSYPYSTATSSTTQPLPAPPSLTYPSRPVEPAETFTTYSPSSTTPSTMKSPPAPPPSAYPSWPVESARTFTAYSSSSATPLAMKSPPAPPPSAYPSWPVEPTQTFTAYPYSTATSSTTQPLPASPSPTYPSRSVEPAETFTTYSPSSATPSTMKSPPALPPSAYPSWPVEPAQMFTAYSSYSATSSTHSQVPTYDHKLYNQFDHYGNNVGSKYEYQNL